MLKKLTWLLATVLVFASLENTFGYEALTGVSGVLRYDSQKAFDGYTLFSPNDSKNVYLIDNEGKIVHIWKTVSKPGRYAVLLPNGNLLRGIETNPKPLIVGALAGGLQELDWQGNVVWEYSMATENEISHHDFKRLANGNTLILGFERISQEQAKGLGRKEGFKPVRVGPVTHHDFWTDFVREVNRDGETVWEWHAIDHLGSGPDKLDFNYTLPVKVGEAYATFDWSHFNTVDYLPDSDQILVNSRNLSEFYLIDRKTGKITYRWGNPTAYDPAAKKPGWIDDGDQKLFGPHCTNRLANGHFLIFDNGSERPQVQRSRIVEMDPETGGIVWEYAANIPQNFLSHRQGSVQRLPNGNTLICASAQGHIFEVTQEKQIVWEFVSPLVKDDKVQLVFGDEGDGNRRAHGLQSNAIHRAYKYAKDYPGLQGKDLTPKDYVCGADAPVFYKMFSYIPPEPGSVKKTWQKKKEANKTASN